MDQDETEFTTLESSIEKLKKTTNGQVECIAKNKKSVEDINDIKGDTQKMDGKTSH